MPKEIFSDDQHVKNQKRIKEIRIEAQKLKDDTENTLRRSEKAFIKAANNYAKALELHNNALEVLKTAYQEDV